MHSICFASRQIYFVFGFDLAGYQIRYFIIQKYIDYIVLIDTQSVLFGIEIRLTTHVIETDWKTLWFHVPIIIEHVMAVLSLLKRRTRLIISWFLPFHRFQQLSVTYCIARPFSLDFLRLRRHYFSFVHELELQLVYVAQYFLATNVLTYYLLVDLLVDLFGSLLTIQLWLVDLNVDVFLWTIIYLAFFETLLEIVIAQ